MEQDLKMIGNIRKTPKVSTNIEIITMIITLNICNPFRLIMVDQSQRVASLQNLKLNHLQETISLLLQKCLTSIILKAFYLWKKEKDMIIKTNIIMLMNIIIQIRLDKSLRTDHQKIRLQNNNKISLRIQTIMKPMAKYLVVQNYQYVAKYQILLVKQNKNMYTICQ